MRRKKLQLHSICNSVCDKQQTRHKTLGGCSNSSNTGKYPDRKNARPFPSSREFYFSIWRKRPSDIPIGNNPKKPICAIRINKIIFVWIKKPKLESNYFHRLRFSNLTIFDPKIFSNYWKKLQRSSNSWQILPIALHDKVIILEKKYKIVVYKNKQGYIIRSIAFSNEYMYLISLFEVLLNLKGHLFWNWTNCKLILWW